MQVGTISLEEYYQVRIALNEFFRARNRMYDKDVDEKQVKRKKTARDTYYSNNNNQDIILSAHGVRIQSLYFFNLSLTNERIEYQNSLDFSQFVGNAYQIAFYFISHFFIFFIKQGTLIPQDYQSIAKFIFQFKLYENECL